MRELGCIEDCGVGRGGVGGFVPAQHIIDPYHWILSKGVAKAMHEEMV